METGTINCVVLGITCGAVIWYCIETRKLRKVSQLEVRLNVINNTINNFVIYFGGTHEGISKKICFGLPDIIEQTIKSIQGVIEAESKKAKPDQEVIDNKEILIKTYREFHNYKLKRNKIIEEIDKLESKKTIRAYIYERLRRFFGSR